jgi:hypothetical protein
MWAGNITLHATQLCTTMSEAASAVVTYAKSKAGPPATAPNSHAHLTTLSSSD